MYILVPILFTVSVCLGLSDRPGEDHPCGTCTRVLQPVCGEDPNLGFKTFNNLCELAQMNKCKKGNFQLKHDDVCLPREPKADAWKVEHPCGSPCPENYKPVCAYDSAQGYLSFTNECFLLEFNSCNNMDFKVNHEGECTGLE